ncbi:MAG: HAD-IIB family hydrolase [Pseudomonadota bacterium]|nr:HAD-IIB family hydrolase [Pseudomonadota bacterium]
MNFELKKITLLIFTDIDGTLINNDTFFEGKNIEIAETLHEHNHILIYNSSKTFDEIVNMQKKFNTSFPFICETGGGIYYKNLLTQASDELREGYSIMYESKKIEMFKKIIKEEVQKNFKDDLDMFDDLCLDEKSRLSGLKGNDLHLASKRDFSILINWKSDDGRYSKFKSVLHGHGLKLIKGGRFSHICASHDKGQAVKFFLNQIKSSGMYNKILTIGIGDSTNDLEMLSNVDYACVVKSKNNNDLMKKIDISKVLLSTQHAPEGWAECIHKIFTQIKLQEQAYG